MSIPINRNKFEGQKFRHYRENKLLLSQEALARRLGISARTISRWENDEATPSPLAYDRLLETLNDEDIEGEDTYQNNL